MALSLTHAALPYPIRGARYSLPITFRTSAGVPTDPTTPDTEFSIDGGASFTDCAEEVASGGTLGLGYITLTGAETNNDLVLVAAKSSNCVTTPLSVHPRILVEVTSGTLAAGSAGGGTIPAALPPYDLTGCFIKTTGGTGGGGTGGANNQARKIVTYTVSTGVFTVSPNWETAPDNTTTYSVLLPEGATIGTLKIHPTAVANLNTIYNTDYATIYNTTDKAFNSKLGDFAHGGASANTTLGTFVTGAATLASADVTGALTVGGGVSISNSNTNGKGLYISGNGTGHAVHFSSPSGAGANALYLEGRSSSGYGLRVIGDTGQPAVSFRGGATGAAFELIGGSTSGTGMYISTTDGHGIDIVAGGGGKVDINADITGAFTGNLSGSVGSVVGAVGSVTGNVGGNVTGSVGSVVGAVGSVTGNVGGNVTGSVGSVVGAVGSVTGNVGGSVVGSVGSVTGNVGGNVTGTIGGLTSGALAQFFSVDSGTTYGSAVAGSVVKEIADNAGGGGGSDPWLTSLPGAYTAGQAGYILGTFLDAAVTSRMATYTQPTGFLAATFPGGTVASTTNITAGTITTTTNLTNDPTGVTTLLGRVTAARAGYWDNLNVGGAVASQADITALNQSAARRVLLAGAGQWERPEAGSSTFELTIETFDGDGAPVAATGTPTMAATGILSGNLSANLSAATNPSTGVYRWTYTLTSAATLEQIRFDAAAVISAVTFNISAYSFAADIVSQTWTATDAANLTAIYNKLPTNNIADQTLLNTAIAGVQSDTDDIQTRLPAALVSGRMDAYVGAMGPDVLTSNAIADESFSSEHFAGDALLGQEINSVVGDVQGKVLGAGGGVITGSGVWALNSTGGAITNLTQADVRAAVGLAAANLDTQLTALGVLSAAIKAKTDLLAFTGGNVHANVQVLETAIAQLIADVTLRRQMANVELSANGDTLSKSSLYGIVQQAQEANTVDNPGFITIYKTDGTTELGQVTIATDATAELIVGAS